MRPFRSLSTGEQLAQHFREQILGGGLHGKLPGVRKLVQQLGVSSAAVTGAIKQLEREGLLESQCVVPKGLSLYVYFAVPMPPNKSICAYLNYWGRILQ